MGAPPPGSPNPFSLADTKGLENSMIETGFIDVQKERVAVTFEFASGEIYSHLAYLLTDNSSSLPSNEVS